MRKLEKSAINPGPGFLGFKGRQAIQAVLKAVLAAVFLASIFLAQGCATVRGPSPAELSDSGQAMDLARSLWERGREIPSFAARGGLNLIEGRTTRFVKFELLAIKPDKVVLTLIDPLGRPAFKAVSDGSRLVALDYGSQAAAVGLATASNIRRVLPVGLSLDTLLSILSDALILRPDRAAAALGSEGHIKTLLLSTIDPDGETLWSVTLAPGEGYPLVTGVSIKAQAGRPSLDVTYGTFKSVAVDGSEPLTRQFPHLVDAALGDGRRLTVRYEEVRLGVAIPLELFEAPVPEGFRVDSL